MSPPSFFVLTLPPFDSSPDGQPPSPNDHPVSPTRMTIHQLVRPPVVPPLPPRHPAPCLPPPGYCPGHDTDIGRFAIPDTDADLPTVPTLTITEATPSPSPPAYISASPPKYAALPTNTTEQTLLLAPPPFYIDIDSSTASTGCRRCDVESAFHSRHTCGREGNNKADYIKWILIFLNVAVWSAVIWGYYVEWMDPGGWRWCGGLSPASAGLGGVWPNRLNPVDVTATAASSATLNSWAATPSEVVDSCVGSECEWEVVEC